MAPVYKFAIIQLQPFDLAVPANFARAASYIREAASQGAHLAVLPEYHLTSWCPSHPDFISACAESAAYLAKYQDLARELDINIVPGTICEVHPVDVSASASASASATDTGEGEDGGDEGVVAGQGVDDGKAGKGGTIEIRNMAYWISAGTGALAGSYQKKNLWHSERPYLKPGKHTPHRAFDTPLRMPLSNSSGPRGQEGDDDRKDDRPLRAGLLICWDLAFPEASRALIADGADVIVIPSYWYASDVDEKARALNPDCERLFLESATVCRAFENTCAVVFVNSGGVSQVALPVVGVVGGGWVEAGREECRVVEVDLGVLGVAEGNYLVRRDLKGEGWHYGYELRRNS